ncbi:hypothetical protein GP486_007176 [Trichoglossum hirsutum]|uniref:C2H2-type domain-containing protein n=1 Tax=Trichoglossum hirsutum TaxID=265104 RepID=A0A9P8L7N5_9PEZI|nr:hypothetical protein GP486_007176 [Trichoglossum hirsutum]
MLGPGFTRVSTTSSAPRAQTENRAYQSPGPEASITAEPVGIQESNSAHPVPRRISVMMLLNSDGSLPEQPISQDELITNSKTSISSLHEKTDEKNPTPASSPEPSIIEVRQAESPHSGVDDNGDTDEMDLDKPSSYDSVVPGGYLPHENASQEKLKEEDSKALRSLGLIYHYQYSVFACLACAKPVFSWELRPHLEQYHSQQKATLKLVEQLTARLPGIIWFYAKTRVKPRPRTVIPSLEGIPVERGYHCQFCNAAFRSCDTARKHLQRRHTKDEQQQWKRKKLPMGPMQCFPTGNGYGSVKSKWFQVTVANNAEVQAPRKASVVTKEVLDQATKKIRAKLDEMAKKKCREQRQSGGRGRRAEAIKRSG